jgi:hypothetical protein
LNIALSNVLACNLQGRFKQCMAVLETILDAVLRKPDGGRTNSDVFLADGWCRSHIQGCSAGKDGCDATHGTGPILPAGAAKGIAAMKRQPILNSRCSEIGIAILFAHAHHDDVRQDICFSNFSTLQVTQELCSIGCVIGKVTECLRNRSGQIGSTTVGVELLKVCDEWFSKHLLAYKNTTTLRPNLGDVYFNGNSAAECGSFNVPVKARDEGESRLRRSLVIQKTLTAKSGASLEEFVRCWRMTTFIGTFGYVLVLSLADMFIAERARVFKIAVGVSFETVVVR